MRGATRVARKRKPSRSGAGRGAGLFGVGRDPPCFPPVLAGVAEDLVDVLRSLAELLCYGVHVLPWYTHVA